MTIRAATDATGFVDRKTYTPFERWVLPNTSEVWFRDSDHSYWREVRMMRGSEPRCKGRVAGTSTVAKVFDSGGDGLLHWAAKLQCEGVAKMYRNSMDFDAWGEEAEAYQHALDWLERGEDVWDALQLNKLTWRDIRDQAATRGSNVHREALQALAAGSPVPDSTAMTEEEQGYARGVIAFWLDHEPTPVLSEQVVADLDLGVAGRFDLVYTSRSGVRTLLDLKTKEELPRKKERPFYPVTDQVQLAGYSLLLERSGFEPVTALSVLYVDARGSYELVPGYAGHHDFRLALDVYHSAAEIRAAGSAARKAA